MLLPKDRMGSLGNARKRRAKAPKLPLKGALRAFSLKALLGMCRTLRADLRTICLNSLLFWRLLWVRAWGGGRKMAASLTRLPWVQSHQWVVR